MGSSAASVGKPPVSPHKRLDTSRFICQYISVPSLDQASEGGWFVQPLSSVGEAVFTKRLASLARIGGQRNR
jgi:hypothetical protein